jgi:hypothetical protein
MKRVPKLIQVAVPLFLMVILPMLLIIVSTAQASSLYGCNQRQAWAWVFKNGTWRHAKGDMCAGRYAEGFTGYCTVRTSVEPAVSVNYAGWTNWQCDRVRWSDDRILESRNHGGCGHCWHGSSYSSTTWWDNIYNNSEYVRISGQHDANENGANPSPWRTPNARTAK